MSEHGEGLAFARLFAQDGTVPRAYAHREGIRPLDPIEVAGSAKLPRLWQLQERMPPGGSRWERRALGILQDGGGLQHAIRQCSGHPVSAAFLASITSLHHSRVLILVSGGDTAGRCIVGYFQVPKNVDFDRSIFDCRTANALFESPPGVQLLEVSDLLRLAQLFEHPWFATADIRHFFHQLTLPRTLRRAFKVSCGGKWFEAAVLPMGWTWAPFIAQSIATILMLAGVAGVVEPAPGAVEDAPAPYYLVRREGRVIAIIGVFYDNFIVIGEEEGITRELVRGISKNCRHAGVILKGAIPWTIGPSRLAYLGLDIWSNEQAIWWRHAPTTLDRWRLSSPLAEETTPLLVATAIGRLVWDATARNNTCAHLHHILRISARMCREHRGWRTNWRLTTDECVAINEAMEQVMMNSWGTAKAVNAERLLIASDACPAGGGILGLVGSSLFIMAQWDMNHQHINELELLIALEGLAMDNTTAIAWINAGWCPNPTLCERLQRTLARQARVTAFYIPTARMPADPLSRNDEVVDEEAITMCIEEFEWRSRHDTDRLRKWHRWAE
jgi:hypothetical protein